MSRSGSRRRLLYGLLFATALAVAGAFIALAGWLSRWNLSRPIYFLVLVPVALAAAAFLAIGLRASDATMEGTLPLGKFKVSGPVAVFALVVGVGLSVMPAAPELAALKVRVRAPEGAAAPPQGQVVLDAGQDAARVQDIDSNGEAYFRDLPAHVRSARLRLTPRVAGYEAAAQEAAFPAEGVLDLPLRAVQWKSVIRGTVIGEGDRPLEGAFVDFEHGLASATTDAHGNFRVELPKAAGGSVLVTVQYGGRIGHQGYYTTPNELTLRVGR